ncbi:MAG: CYTH domain-containing protein [Candidatus Neomarinimicrobiota bacterium]|nr:MAG: CYTH domain-containing protein [Candidatus Neomarinimicrobiota bacterium]|tara:strand:- start:955 stop:1422 length:468 start_codon:yes stop_codon:yes gene_type:complete
MGKEIERKFLVDKSRLPNNLEGTKYTQGYISITDSGIVRVRIKGDIAVITIKSAGLGISRDEFEYQIPMDDAKSLLELFNDGVIYKTRYDIVYEGKKWEIDQFHKENEGLWIAEIELQFENESFEIPKWVLEEVTGNEKYYNSYLSKHSFKSWKE